MLFGCRPQSRVREIRIQPRQSSSPKTETHAERRGFVVRYIGAMNEASAIASIRHGTATASLIIRKLASYARQNSLHAALREVGRMERTLFMLEWMQDPELR